MAHPEILRTLTSIDDPILRFVAVTKFYLSGWHIRPPYEEMSAPLRECRADHFAEALKNHSTPYSAKHSLAGGTIQTRHEAITSQSRRRTTPRSPATSSWPQTMAYG
jgi:hypothetical protein